MRQSKTTLKELTAAYRAVLRYGILCNAVALGLVTAPAMAGDPIIVEAGNTFNDTGIDLTVDDGNAVHVTGANAVATLSGDTTISSGVVGVRADTGGSLTIGGQGATISITGLTDDAVESINENSVVNIIGDTVSLETGATGTAAAIWSNSKTDNPTHPAAVTVNAKTIDMTSEHQKGVLGNASVVNIGNNTTESLTISAGQEAAYAYNGAVLNLTGQNLELSSTDSNAVIALAGGAQVNINGDDLEISTSSADWAAVHAGNNTQGYEGPLATVNINADNINIHTDSPDSGMAIAAMSQGIVNVNGNTTLTAKDVVLARGDAQVKINKSGTNTVKMDGNIDFNFDENSSNTPINALVDVTLNGTESYWNGNTVVSYDDGVPPASAAYLEVSDASLKLQNGATWNATQINDAPDYYYTALNNLTVDNGTVNIADATRGITVENLTANNLTIGGAGKMNISNSINTINGTIDDYTAGIVLGDGVSISGDIDFAAGTADKYAAVDGANLTYKMANALGADIQYGQEKAIQVAEGENVTVNKDANFAWFDTDHGLTLSGGDAGTGTIKVRGQLGGINAAVDYTDDSAQEVAYTLTGNETFDGADNIIENAMFTLTGNTTQQDPGHQLTLGNDLNVGAGSTLSVNNANLAGNGSLINNSTLNIKDSNIAVNVVNNGTLISDPTTYSATVTNNGYASFEDDTFTSTAILKNAGTVDLKGETTFDSGALISGSGTTNLTSGSTTHFATDGTTNTTNVTLASGADFTGTLGGSGTLDTRNGNIDTVSGSVSGGRLYMDANALSGAHDTFTGGASGATVAAINLSNTIGDLKNGYGTNGSVTIDMGATVNDNTEIQGNNYYTQVTANGTSVTFSDKLMNSSSVHNQLGDWGQTTAGHYIGTSTAYDTDTNSYSTTNGTTVGAALTALDNQVYTNAQAIDTINNSDVMNSGIDATKVAQITTNQNDIATLTGRVNTLQGGENLPGSVRNTVKTATTMTRNPGDDEYNNFHDGDSVVRAVTELDRNMGTIHGLVGNANTTTTTTGKDYKGNLAVGTTVEDHLVALDNHIGDMRDFNTTNTYATSTDSVAMNLKALDKAIADQSALALGSANAYTDARIDKLDKDLSAGIASAVALSAVATTGVQKGEVAVSGGYGYHNGQSAAAFGAAMGLSNRWSVNAGAGLSNADVSFRAGTSYKFKLF
ncbi:MAG: YadA-like family protein [Alphaproteobacteria bacterium]|nr:YadA-like family protein [Alphaproteobacteria bacterium]